MNTELMILSLAAVTACAASIASTPACAQPSPNVSVYATGLAGPRGLKFGPDGLLYVAEAGFGGTNSTAGVCDQVPAPVGPYLNGNSGRISAIDSAGNRTTVASGFPSAQNGLHETEGVADVAFIGHKQYAVLAGGGCSHGNAAIPNAIVRVDVKTGDWTTVADLSRFLSQHPAKYVKPADFEPGRSLLQLDLSPQHPVYD